MDTFNVSIERHHRLIIFSLMFGIVFFAASCTFHDLIPVCHYLFGCDHNMHISGSLQELVSNQVISVGGN